MISFAYLLDERLTPYFLVRGSSAPVRRSCDRVRWYPV